MSARLVEKYGEARLPRYTSYPTAPKFSAEIGEDDYRQWIGGIGKDPTSLYLHIPFCRSMCWYCGCHTTITERDQPILDYLDVLRREIELVSAASPEPLDVREIHFGGGTPTIIKPEEFVSLTALMRLSFDVAPTANIAVEIDPRTLTAEMADALGQSRVTRASLGVQSFDPVVQKAINRVQSEEVTALAAERLRSNGIGGLNFDLIYGLPHQTVKSCIETVEAAVAMRPDRFAVFGYAHIPSFKKHQRLIDEQALPGAQARNEQAEAIAEALVAAGYRRIGLDHFALPADDLARAGERGLLHRNFQGYTTDACENLLGFGASAIGRSRDGYVQNEVPPGVYAKKIAAGTLATAKGYRMTAEDRLRAHVIERLMCQFQVDLEDVCAKHSAAPASLLASAPRLRDLIADGIVRREGFRLTVADDAHHFVRAVASAFDAYIGASNALYSRVV